MKWILRYLKGTSNHVLRFRGEDTQFHGYGDLDMAGDLDQRRSTTGYLFTLARATDSWISRCRK
jgi:hypothetical protein